MINQNLIHNQPVIMNSTQPHAQTTFFIFSLQKIQGDSIHLSLVTDGLLLSNLGSKNNSLIEVHRVFSIGGSNITI